MAALSSVSGAVRAVLLSLMASGPAVDNEDEPARPARRVYSPFALADAVAESAADSTMSERMVAAKHGVPRSTLRAHKKHRPRERAGRPPVLLPDDELWLARWCWYRAERNAPVLMRELRWRAAVLARLRGISTWPTKVSAGRNWLSGFLARWPELFITRSRVTHGRLPTKEEWMEFFACVRVRARPFLCFTSLGLDFGLALIYHAYVIPCQALVVLFKILHLRWWSVDETGFCGANPIKSQKVIAPVHRKGDYPRLVDASKNYREHWTCIVAVSAGGQSIPAVWIVQNDGELTLVMIERILNGATPGTRVWSSRTHFSDHIHSFASSHPLFVLMANDGFVASGWINNVLFARWIAFFYSQVSPTPSPSNPVVLFLDGHGTRFQPELMEWCVEHGIHIIVGPPNSTAHGQVNDRTCFTMVKVTINLTSHLLLCMPLRYH